MNEIKLKYFTSNARFNVYLSKTGNDYDKALALYKLNIELSEAFYPILSVIEISLRNSINNKLEDYFKDSYWFENNLPIEFLPFVLEAKQKLNSQNKNITSDRIISELNFGFWNRLFNRNYTILLWKPLHTIFKNMPKKDRKREKIANSLYNIRTLRNRIYHYEPIFGNPKEIEKIHSEMILFLTWLDKDLPNLISDINRFDNVLLKLKNLK
jgi:hypothetical protein